MSNTIATRRPPRYTPRMGWKSILIMVAVLAALLLVGAGAYFSATAGDAAGISAH